MSMNQHGPSTESPEQDLMRQCGGGLPGLIIERQKQKGTPQKMPPRVGGDNPDKSPPVPEEPWVTEIVFLQPAEMETQIRNYA